MQAKLYPSEIVTLGLVFALKGVGERAFYRWLAQDHLDLFPNLPDRTRSFRLFKVYQYWTQCFLADPTVLGIADTYGIELIHPIREGRSEAQKSKLKTAKKETAMNIQILMMMFPVVFMFHDFEELCFLESWIRKNADYLRNKFIAKNWLRLEGYSTSALGIGILLMFLFVSATSILSVMFNLYALFAAAMIVFTLHNLVHIIQPILLRRYIPAMGSSIITLPYSLYVLSYMNHLNLFIWREAATFSVFFGALTFTYLAVAGRIGFWIDKQFNRS